MALSLSTLLNPLLPRQKYFLPDMSTGADSRMVLLTVESIITGDIETESPGTSCVSIPFLNWNQDMTGMGTEVALQEKVTKSSSNGARVDWGCSVNTTAAGERERGEGGREGGGGGREGGREGERD